ncbi:hypothetical protein THAOC_05961 [Thalassiosira oceanica]|uniref:Uncharacterized protein n=1 Tax=Thalassiosira oceanica TaxID=159749 RepID=K0T5U8_THAOC|nr:hypothetical protein THAOC_05961 [Thalassiosira oceanica]|eukprot:EJK72509.1 hypothetical protein THAOC_05961 [Thalassiosira oceanica]
MSQSQRGGTTVSEQSTWIVPMHQRLLGMAQMVRWDRSRRPLDNSTLTTSFLLLPARDPCTPHCQDRLWKVDVTTSQPQQERRCLPNHAVTVQACPRLPNSQGAGPAPPQTEALRQTLRTGGVPNSGRQP